MIINDINQLSPQMQPKAKLFLEKAKEVRSDIIIFETLRTKKRQLELFKSGDSWTLTSFHLSGNAFDICFFDKGKYSWQATYEEWKEFIQIGKDCELDNLAPLEYGHFQNNFNDLKPMLYEKEIIEDYSQMSLSQMRRVAIDWGELDSFQAGLKVKTKPQTYRDLKDTISFGRIILMK